MTQEVIKKEVQNTLATDAQAWFNGYMLADEECNAYMKAQAELGNIFSFILPVAAFLFLIVWAWKNAKKCAKINEDNIQRLEKSISNQLVFISEQEKTNSLLQQLLEKLGNK